MKKKITIAIMVMLLSTSFMLSGCGEKDMHTEGEKPTVEKDLDRAGDDVKDSIRHAGDAIENGADDIVSHKKEYDKNHEKDHEKDHKTDYESDHKADHETDKTKKIRSY